MQNPAQSQTLSTVQPQQPDGDTCLGSSGDDQRFIQTEMIIPELSTGMKQKDGLSRCPINQSDITALV
jgi:hypothetical protein